MKAFLCACLLVSLAPITQAYEADIHYSTTYVLARAVGWTEAEARTIASANQGVDENQETVAALEMESTLANSLHQAEKNLRFHCFSKTRGQAGRISADVRQVIAGHFAEVPGQGADPRSKARRLIALGAALHCQQDAYSHEGFGGSCGAFSGSCFGHTYQTFLDQLIFGVLGKHPYDPDHPAVSGERLLPALQGTVAELSARAPRSSRHRIPLRELAALSDALRHSGLELPGDVRRECNRHIAGRWLHDFLSSSSRSTGASEQQERLAPSVAASCRNESLRSAVIAKIPAPRFPRLDANAAPYLVRADGSYELAPVGGFAGPPPGVRTATFAAHAPNYNGRVARVQWSHWSQILALPPVARVALLTADGAARAR